MAGISRLAELAGGHCETDILPDVDMRALAVALLGQPNRAMSKPGSLRFGRHGSLAVDVAGGRFMDFEAGAGGGILDLVRHVQGGTRAEAAKWLRQWQGDAAGPSVQHAPAIAVPPAPDDGPWRRLWAEAAEPAATPVEAYLASRGLSLPSPEPGRVIRYHPRCPFQHVRLPAMLALIRNAESGKEQGLHRTPLTPAGARARDASGAKRPKMMLGQAAGGVAMLSEDETVETALAIAEGIESALAGLCRFPWIPVWAALSAGGVRGFPLLAGVEAITVYADHDEAGTTAARALCQRYSMAGVSAELVMPKRRGNDLADMLINTNACATPHVAESQGLSCTTC